MKQYRKQNGLHLLTVTVLCLITAVLSFNIALFRDGGFFTLTDDFNAQQIPFTIALHNQIINKGIDSWMWSYGLGTSTVQGMSFYQLGSPFFWISMLFPARAFGYLVG